MKAERAKRVNGFPQTRWSLVGRAGGRDPNALATLISLYLPVLRSYLCNSRAVVSSVAEEIVQGFAEERLLAGNLLDRATPERGRFRSLLIVSLNHYVSDLRRREKQRLPEAGPLLSIDAPEFEAPPSATDVDIFDLLWARQVMRHALDGARNECMLANQARFWTLFELRVLGPALDGSEPVQYAECIERLGFPSVAVACNALVTVQRRLRAALRATVRKYTHPEEIEDELVSLRRVISERGCVLDVMLAPGQERRQ